MADTETETFARSAFGVVSYQNMNADSSSKFQVIRFVEFTGVLLFFLGGKLKKDGT